MKVLLKCMPVRWNAFFLSAERFVENEKALKMFFTLECKDHSLTDDEWMVLKELVSDPLLLVLWRLFQS